jgi:hypothetical protein
MDPDATQCDVDAALSVPPRGMRRVLLLKASREHVERLHEAAATQVATGPYQRLVTPK